MIGTFRYLAFCLLPILLGSLCQAKEYPYRWVFVASSLRSDKDVAEIERIVRTASEHGLNGMVLSAGLDRLDRQPPQYLERLQRVKEICDRSGVEIIPNIFSAGYGGSVLGSNRNLAAGIPVKDAPLLVKNGVAVLKPDRLVRIANGGFEQYEGNQFRGHRFHDKPGEVSFVDTAVSHSGKASLRFENFGQFAHGHARLMQEVEVQPQRCYRLSCWVKTEALEPRGAFRIQVLTRDGRNLAPYDPAVPSTTGWRRVVMGFNTLEYDKVNIYAGAWGGKAGRFWMDDLEIEEVALLNVLRRPGTPVTVRGEATGTVYEEGRDFAPIQDEGLNFRFDHEPPRIKLLPGSRIKEGERLKVSYYHGMGVNRGQVTVCMSEPEVYKIWENQAALMHKHLAPSKYLLSMDEIRAGGACQACKQRHLSMAQILGDCVTKQVNILRRANPKTEVLIWSDMLDPNHNAHGNYYLVEGDYTGSWQYVPKDLTIVCWYYEKRKESLGFFSAHGFRTLAGAYYDGDTLDNPRGWLEVLDRTPQAVGIMYTTWQNKYDLLAPFGDLVAGKVAQPSAADKVGQPPSADEQRSPGAGVLQASQEPFVPLFNGKNLDGWVNVNCAPETWTVREGMIVCTGIPTGVLCTERHYENYILELEWRHLRERGNAGLFVHSDPLPVTGQPFTRAIEIQIMDGNGGDVFAIQGATMTPAQPHPKGWTRALPSENRMNPLGQWNQYRVECRDGMVALAVNGKEVTRGYHANPRQGYICLESEGGQIHFRNIRIRELPGSNPPAEVVAQEDQGFRSLYNGLDLRGWKRSPGHEGHWQAKDWILSYDGKSEAPGEDKHLWTERSFGDFTLIADWRLPAKPKLEFVPVVLPDGSQAAGADGTPLAAAVMDAGDSGIYLRGQAKGQVNIWSWPVGSGELWGYRTDITMPAEVRRAATPILNADNPPGRWNRFEITAKGERVTVKVNGQTVIRDAHLPGLPAQGPLALQHHGDPVEFANLYIKELEPVKVIFDTDMDGDNDDVAAAAMLHVLADAGKVDILAMGVVSRCPHSPACLDAINTYYGRGDIPIGVYKGTALVKRGSPYAQKVAEGCPHDTGLAGDMPDVVGVYRRVLSGRPDGAVTMIAVGQMNNLVDLLASGPDRHSPLAGRDLVRRKVATLFVMAPYFNERNEYQRAYNFTTSPQAARELVAQWPTKIKFGEGNLGHRHFIGSHLSETPAGHPARIAFEAYFAGKKENKRHCADPTTVLYAVCGTRYFGEVGPGACEVREDGFTRWNAAGGKQHFYNTQKLPVGELEQVMEQLLIQPPKLPGRQPPSP